MDHSYYFCLVFVMLSCALFIDALWSPAGKGLTFWLSSVMSICKLLFFYFPIGILGQVWYLIASIPDLYPLCYFKEHVLCIQCKTSYKIIMYTLHRVSLIKISFRL